MAKSGENNLLTIPDLNDKEMTIQDIVAGYRKLGYSEEKIEKIRADLLSGLQKEPFGAETDEIFGDRDKILNNLKENKCVEVEENVNYMGYKGRKVHIKLPEIKGKFDGFTSEYFVSYDSVFKKAFESNPELGKKSSSMEDVGGLLGAMNKYMEAMGVKTDGDMDYENDLKYWKTENYRCNAGDCLKQIAGLNDWYWLKDKDVYGVENSRAEWDCNDDDCNFRRRVNDGTYANLFLRLS